MANQTPFGCPVCGFTCQSAEAVRSHFAEMADDKKHQEYDLNLQENE